MSVFALMTLLACTPNIFVFYFRTFAAIIERSHCFVWIHFLCMFFMHCSLSIISIFANLMTSNAKMKSIVCVCIFLASIPFFLNDQNKVTLFSRFFQYDSKLCVFFRFFFQFWFFALTYTLFLIVLNNNA